MGRLEVTKVVDWNGNEADETRTFEICLTGPSFPLGSEAGACRTVDYDGGVVSWADLTTGQYTVTEVDPGEGWTVSGNGTAVNVAADATASHTITNTAGAPAPAPMVHRQMLPKLWSSPSF